MRFRHITGNDYRERTKTTFPKPSIELAAPLGYGLIFAPFCGGNGLAVLSRSQFFITKLAASPR
jgi:hypothetical protein